MVTFIAVSFSLMLGMVLGAVGIPLAVWVAAALYRADVARDWAVWTMERSPLPPYAPPSQVASDMLQRDSLIAAGLLAALLCLLALSWLLAARRALRAVDESHDGKATIDLKGQPLRVGRPVEGSIWLTQGSRQGELYRLELSCKRGHGSARSGRTETAYFEELEVEPLLTPVGWSLPFSFAVPPIAPPSGVANFMSGPAYRWSLAVQPAKGWISTPSVFALDLGAAPPEELGSLEKSERGRREPGMKRAAERIAPEMPREPLLQRGASPPSSNLKTEPLSPLPLSGDPLSPPRSAPNSFGAVTPGDVRAPDTLGRYRSAGASEGASSAASPGQPREDGRTAAATAPAHDRASAQQLSPSVLQEVRRAAEMGLLDYGAAPGIRSGPRLHDGPEFQDPLPDDKDEVRGTSVVSRVVKWLFLVVFGGVLAVSAVAVATAMLLRFVF
jgi:hypothetical protein